MKKMDDGRGNPMSGALQSRENLAPISWPEVFAPARA